MQHFTFYECMEEAADKMLKQVKKCSQKSNMSYSVLTTCYAGAESNELQRAADAATPSNHKYVPWIVIGGKTFDVDGKSEFVTTVCTAAKKNGVKQLPKICNKKEAAKKDSSPPKVIPCNATTPSGKLQ